MGKHIFVDGALVATEGNLYTRNISAGGSWHPDDAEIIVPSDGILYITEDTGSIFGLYYVNGFVTASALGMQCTSEQQKGAIIAFADSYEFTIRDYEAGLRLIKIMLDNIPTGPQKGLYLQQQFVSTFSLMEQFLSCSFVRQTCDREDSYYKVLASGLLLKNSPKEVNRILTGPDGLTKELKYIEVTNRLIYHNASKVRSLFNIAFGIDVDLAPLDSQLRFRNDIVHRFGHNVDRVVVSISESDVWKLINTVDEIVRKTASQIVALPNTEAMYPD